MNRKGDIMTIWFRSMKQKDIESHPDYRAAREFAKAFEPKRGRSYKWVYDDAMRAFDLITDSIAVLDRKAENIIKYIAPGTGLLGLAFAWLAQSNHVNLWAGILVLVGAVALTLSMINSLLSLRPHRTTFTPDTKDALNCANYEDYDSEQALGMFATGVNSSTVGRMILAARKAAYVQRAYKFFIVGFLLILVGLFWGIVTGGTSPV